MLSPSELHCAHHGCVSIELQVVPLQCFVCTAQELTEALRSLVAPHPASCSYGVSYSCRGDDRIQIESDSRPDCWLSKEAALGAVSLGLGEGHAVDLKNPDLVVCVRLWRRFSDGCFECGVSVVPGAQCKVPCLAVT